MTSEPVLISTSPTSPILYLDVPLLVHRSSDEEGRLVPLLCLQESPSPWTRTRTREETVPGDRYVVTRDVPSVEIV